MSGNFISLHPAEFMSLIDGLELAYIFSKTIWIYLPFIVLVFVAGFFIWSVRLSQDAGELPNFILWLILATLISGLIMYDRQSVVVELSPVVLENKNALLNFKSNNGEMSADDKGYYYKMKTSGAAALLSIPDKIASYTYYLLDNRILNTFAKQIDPINNVACMDPRLVAMQIHSIMFAAATDLYGNTQMTLTDYQNQMASYKRCLESGFDYNIKLWASKNFSSAVNWKRVAAVIAGSAAAGAIAGSFLPGVGTLISAVVGAGAGAGIAAIDIISSISQAQSINTCGDFLKAMEPYVNKYVEVCKKAGAFNENMTEEQFKNAVFECVKGAGKCADLLEEYEKLIAKAEEIPHEIGVQKEGEGANIETFRDRVAQSLTDLVSGYTNNTMFAINTKIGVLAAGQGIALSLFLLAYPFVLLFATIPSFRGGVINWGWILGYNIAYLLVKLWFVAIILVINLAYHTFAMRSL